MSYTDQYDPAFFIDTMMGPNAMRITEELAGYLPLRPGMRLLDLGCGKGLSSILLAEKYDCTVFAADLWIDPTENAERFASLGLDGKIIPVSVDATKGLPFARSYFDMIVSVDSYHYFGNNTGMLPSLLPYVKSGGYVAVAVPGLKKDFPGGVYPKELLPWWQPDMNLYSCDWWRSTWEKSMWNQAESISIETCREMDCFKQAWEEWLACPNPYAKDDRGMMEAEGGKYYNLVQITGRKQ